MDIEWETDQEERTDKNLAGYYGSSVTELCCAVPSHSVMSDCL